MPDRKWVTVGGTKHITMQISVAILACMLCKWLYLQANQDIITETMRETMCFAIRMCIIGEFFCCFRAWWTKTRGYLHDIAMFQYQKTNEFWGCSCYISKLLSLTSYLRRNNIRLNGQQIRQLLVEFGDTGPIRSATWSMKRGGICPN